MGFGYPYSRYRTDLAMTNTNPKKREKKHNLIPPAHPELSDAEYLCYLAMKFSLVPLLCGIDDRDKMRVLDISAKLSPPKPVKVRKKKD